MERSVLKMEPMRRLFALVPVALVALGSIACTAAGTQLGDVGDEGDTLGSSTSRVTKGCSASREEILASAGGARANAIERGFAWLDAQVPYSQSAQHEGYRTDCSGFVSMCWELPQSFTTADFAAGSAGNTILADFEELQPGDGLVRRSGGSGHAVLFLGWEDEGHTEACVLEQASSASDMQFGIRTVASLESQAYKAMRADDMPDAEPGVAADEGDAPAAVDTEEEPSVTEPEPEPLPTPRAGDVCGSDADCSPGIPGTGLICDTARGRCIEGCKFDLQCPGAELCKKGACTL